MTGNGTVSLAETTTYAQGTFAMYAASAGAGQTFTVTAGHTLVVAFVATPIFKDTAALSAQDQRATTFLAAIGVINPASADGSGNFQLGAPVNRAQMATFIARTFGWESELHASNFPDRCGPGNPSNCIDPRLWNDVAALKNRGIVGGGTDSAICQASVTATPCCLPRDGVKMVPVVWIVARAFIKEPTLRPTGVWDRFAAVPGQYTNLATYRANVGTIPGQTSDATFPTPSGRAPASLSSRSSTSTVALRRLSAHHQADAVRGR